MSTFQALSKADSEIRLIRPRHGSIPSSYGHNFEMTCVSLNAPLPYHAVSYTWGNSTEDTLVNIDGQPSFITGNLHYALNQIYAVLQPTTWLWIDSLCINQADVVEKGWQVAQMRRVFATAELVYICMGPAADNSDRLIEFLSPLSDEAARAQLFALGNLPVDTHDPAQRQTATFVRKLVMTNEIYTEWFHKALQAMAKRPNWHRCWIIQEIALAQRGLLLCGSKSMSLDAFHAILFALEKVSKWREESDFPTKDGVIQRPSFYQSAILGLEARLVRGKTDYSTLRWFLLSRASYGGSEVESGPFYAATDPRDIIFAFLGVISDRALLGLEPDYTKPVGRIYAEATAAMLRHHPYHHKLEMCSFPKDIPDLPSWVPDWSRIGRVGVRQPLCWINEFVASGPRMLTDDDVVISQNLALRRWGFQCDTVESVFVFDPVAGSDQEELEMSLSSALASNKTRAASLAAILNFARCLPSACRDRLETRVWRTLVVDLYRDLENDDWYDCMSQRIMCDESLAFDTFSAQELAFIWRNVSATEAEQPQQVVDRFFAGVWQHAVKITKGRTIFSTNSGRLGLGPYCMRAGDIVTILAGTGAPILVRRTGQMYNYVGDAYIEGIMYGELMKMEQNEQAFEIL